jgi:Rieske Fe-S protein
VVLEVADLDRAEKFFREDVCLKHAGRGIWPEERPNSAFHTNAGQYLVLVEVPEVRLDGPGVHTNFLLNTEDYYKVVDRLRETGCLAGDFRGALGQRAVGEVSQYFDDPDGHRLQLTAYSDESSLVPAAGQGKITAGPIEDFPVGSVTYVEVGKLFIVHLDEGFLALNEVCTHMQCTVVYQPEHYRFYCACHYNKFTRKGEHIGHTAGTPPLYSYVMEFVDGQIVVDTDKTIPRAPSVAKRMQAGPAAGGARS